ncbi:DUF2254 family protein [Sanguibacter sp. 25GB23B1]|uniref:DUF2254 domain-containing protein n=1 Tax=unclassified Sanguibacter TaxID=2645534 RepID=UPI0032AF28FF
MSSPWAWRARFRTRTYLVDSLWVLPLVCAVLGGLLGWASTLLDTAISAPSWLQYEPGTATTVLTTIAGAMVGLTGLVVTIGVVVVQQATSVLSPRFMRLWYRQPLQKVVLGTFAGTFSFAFSNLRRVEDGAVPDLGVTAAGLLCLGSLVLLLVYLDNFTQHLRPVAVAALVLAAGRRVATPASPPSSRHSDVPVRTEDAPVRVVHAREAGVVQGIDHLGLLGLAHRHACVVELGYGVGTMVPVGAPLFTVSGPRAPRDAQLTRCVVLGVERTVDQDPAFALRILVDIAVRALSPAIHDPTTAVQVLDYIELFLQSAALEPLHGTYVLVDDDGSPRVSIPGRTWEQYVELALVEVRQVGGGDVQVCRRLAALLDQLLATVPPENRPALDAQRTALATTVTRSFPEPEAFERASRADRQGLGGTTP